MSEKSVNILVVAGDEVLRQTVVSALEGQGYRALGCDTGGDALRLAREVPPQVVLADLSPDDMPPSRLVEGLKAADAAAGVILVSCPGAGRPSDDLTPEEVVGHLTKPLDMAELRVLVRRAVRHRSLSSENARLTASLRDASEALEKEVSRRKFADEALKTSLRRLELAFDQATLHTHELKQEITQRRQAEEALARSEELRRLRAAREAKEEERRRLAEELHDETLAELAGVLAELGFLARQAQGGAAEIEQGLDALRDRVREIEGRLREIVQGIFPSVLTNLGLLPALRSYLEELDTPPDQDGTPLEIEVRAKGFDNGRLPEQVELATYRFVQ